jgi:hypothetical protein
MIDITSSLTAAELATPLRVNEKGKEDGAPVLPIPDGINPKTIPQVKNSTNPEITLYRDSSKAIEHYVVRTADNKGLPWCWWRYSDGREGWKCKHPREQNRPLLNLPNIINHTDKPICVGEGEKCAKALQKLFPDFIATTSCGGANAASKSDWYVMCGRDVILFLDNDEAGVNYGRDAHQLCKQAGAKSIKQYNMQIFAQYSIESGSIIERTRELPEKYDIADALEEKWTAELLVELEVMLQQKGLQLVADYPEPDPAALLNDVDEDWPDPLPIKAELLPVEPFHSQLLPAPLRGVIEDMSNSIQCPMDFLAVPTMVMFGSLIGAGCGMMAKQKDDWLTIPNIWGGIIARSGGSKTPALSKALKPLDPLEKKAQEKYEQELVEYFKNLEAYKHTKDMLIGRLKKKHKSNDGSSVDLLNETQQTLQSIQEPEKPICRRFKINDSTIEKTGELLSQNPRGLLYFRDELIGFLVTLDKENHVADRAFFLETWGGDSPYTSDRISRGRTHCNNMCLSILGGTQPSKLLSYLNKAANNIENDGLMQRFQLLVYPDEKRDWNLVDEYPNQNGLDRVFRIAEEITSMNFTEYGAVIGDKSKIPCFHFSAEAQNFFNVWLTELMRTKVKNNEEEEIICEHLSKYPKLLLALALIFHIIDLVDGRAKGHVALESAERAAAWCDYLESHARRIYGMALDKTHSSSALSKKIKKRSLNDGFTARDVHRKGWSMLTRIDDVQDACEELVDAGWLRERYIESSPGKGKTVYLINPKIWGNHE